MPRLSTCGRRREAATTASVKAVKASTESDSSNRHALIAWMESRKISAVSLAQTLGVCRATIYAWRKGKPPSRRNAAILAKLSDNTIPADGWD